MLFQHAESDLIFSTTLLGDLISIGIQVIILLLGYFIHKKNSYTYGLFFMISAISSILAIILFEILRIISSPFIIIAVFLYISSIFYIIGVVFLIFAIYKVYDTHRTDIIESKIK
ncbi:MAG: hypothetical protein ACFFC3_10250 [Candidatus Odinarchaeota archaeon]